MKNEQKLKEELAQSGATEKDIEALVMVAKKVEQHGQMMRLNAFKESQLDKIAPKKKTKLWLVPFLSPLLLVLFVLVGGASFSVYAAQGSLPGQILYPLKKLTESAVVLVNSNFEQEVILRRSEEIKGLVAEDKHPVLIQTTLKDFEDKAQRIGEKKSDKFNQSLQNLKEAEIRSNSEQKKEINRVLTNIEKDDENEDQEEVKGESKETVPSKKESGKSDQKKDDD